MKCIGHIPISFLFLSSVLQEPIKFPSCTLGSAKAQAVQEEVDKMLQKVGPFGSGLLQPAVCSAETVGGVVSRD